MVLFAIRDDDLNVSTTSEELISVYDGIWDLCPVSFATIPFISNKVLLEEYGVTREPGNSGVAQNEALVRFVKGRIRQGQIDIILHGYNHDSMNGIPEFGRNDLDFKALLKEGKAYLEELFETDIKVFVPPHNYISRKGQKALGECGLNLLITYRYRLRRLPLSFSMPTYLLKNILFAILNKDNKLVIPETMRFPSHMELGCYGLYRETSVEDLVAGLQHCIEHSHKFVLATHYHAFRRFPQMKKVLDEFWKEVVDNYHGFVTFVSANQLFEEPK